MWLIIWLIKLTDSEEGGNGERETCDIPDSAADRGSDSDSDQISERRQTGSGYKLGSVIKHYHIKVK